MENFKKQKEIFEDENFVTVISMIANINNAMLEYSNKHRYINVQQNLYRYLELSNSTLKSSKLNFFKKDAVFNALIYGLKTIKKIFIQNEESFFIKNLNETIELLKKEHLKINEVL